jgi:hypothetical protein
MNIMQETISLAERTCDKLDKLADDELNFTLDMRMHFERMAWESLRLADELRAFREWLEG